MFTQTIDNKKIIIDSNGNEIVDLTKSIFSVSASAITSYKTIKMTETYNMRPDKAAFNVYGNENYAEMILKYSGISNPFSLGDDDILMIPDENMIYTQLAKEEEKRPNNDDKSKEQQIKNYFKFASKYKTDQTSYDELENLKIDSGVIDPNIEKEYTVPYISNDGQTAVTIRNGRMYFGEDNNAANLQNNTAQLSRPAGDQEAAVNAPSDIEGNLTPEFKDTLDNIYQTAEIGSPANIPDAARNTADRNIPTNFGAKMQAIIDSTQTALSDQCAINGMTLVDFTRATIKNQK